jgi:lipoprotein-anchoring transpeptidase ErfK/SrfK
MSSSIQGKTIRPGGLRYTYYKSGAGNKKQTKASAKASKKKGHFKSILLVLILIVAAPIAYGAAASNKATLNSSTSTSTHKAKTSLATQPKKTSTPAVAAAPNNCAGNQLDKLVLVSISKQHLWACDGSSELYDSAVVTGDEQHADTLTPPGTYHIYAMATDRTLTGSDENGSWNDFVYYWMPFLDNQYGAYGLHDATWRTASEFGNININTSNASNGCVELPLATAKWIYDWADVGTTVTIES